MDNGEKREKSGAAPRSDTDGYRSYLLRCWRETGPAGLVTWRFRLQSVSGDEQHGFRDLRAVFEHVGRLLATELDGPDTRNGSAEEPPVEQGDER